MELTPGDDLLYLLGLLSCLQLRKLRSGRINNRAEVQDKFSDRAGTSMQDGNSKVRDSQGAIGLGMGAPG